MRSKLITLIVVMVVCVTAIIAQQYERVLKIYKDGVILNSYVVSEIDSIKFDNVAIYEVGVQTSPIEGGTATINGSTGVELLREGENVTLRAAASAGHSFVEWTKDGVVVSTENPYTTTVEGATIYVANFQKGVEYCHPTGNMQHSVRYLSNFAITDGVGSLEVKEIQEAPKDAAYKDRTSSVFVTEAGSTLYFSKMNWVGEWMHAYVYIDYNSDGEFNTISNALALNDGELVSYNFLSEIGSTQGTNSKGEVVSNSCDVLASNIPSWVLPTTLTPGDYRLRFKVDWNDSDPCGSTRENNEIQKNGGCVCDIILRIVAPGTGPIATSKVTPEGTGTVEIIDENKRDGKVVLSATSNYGYVFEEWRVNGETLSTENPYEASINIDTEYEALFRTAQIVDVTVTSSEGGEAEVSEANPLEGTTVVLTATPSNGYIFLNWTLNGEVVSTDNPYTAVIRGNSEYKANFGDKYAQITNLPTIFINTENGVGVTSKENYVTAYVTVRGAANEEDNITEVLTEIKGRGNSTWNMAKKPYRLKFDEKIQFLGNAAKEKNWVLLANYADKTLMRNALAFETARNMFEFGFTPSVTFVDVVINGENLGSYILTDQVEVKSKRVPVTEQETTTTSVDPEITGGYLVEVDGYADSEASWFKTTKGMKVTIKYPKDDEINSDQSSYISNYTQQMEDALFSANYTDAETGWRRYIDETSMVDWYIACELFGNSDAWWSTYMYKERDDVFKFGPLWDFDIAFNNDNRLGDATKKLMRTYAHDPKTWVERWCTDTEFMNAVKARWAEIRANGLAVFMNNYIDNTAAYLSESQQNNFQRWNILNKVVHLELAARGSYSAEVEFLKNYVNNRIAYLDGQFQLAEPIYSVIVSSSDTSMGEVTVSSSTVNANDVVTLTATPNDGYVFDGWMIEGEIVSTSNPYEIEVTENLEVKASFSRYIKPLPKVYVNTPNGVAITSKEIWTEGCEIVVVDADGVETINSTTSFRGRGNTTWGYPKKPYAIKLDSKSQVLGMPKHKRWVLLANWMDRTLLRNAVTFEMARQIMDWAPRGEFVEFYLNGTHQGNYYLCEQIKIDKNRINISEFEDDATEGEGGGYLLEFDTNYQAEINYFMSKYYNYPVTIKDPDEEIITSWQHPLYTYIYNYIGDTESALKNNNFETVFSKIDYSTFVDYFLIQEISGNGECRHPKSSYMYKDAGGKICAGPVWDFDWGTYSVGDKGFINNQALWYKELFKSAEFKAALKTRWAEIKHVFENIDTFIDEQAELIRASEAVNHEMWPIDNRHNYPNGDELIDFDSAVDRLKQAIEERIVEVEAAINSL